MDFKISITRQQSDFTTIFAPAMIVTSNIQDPEKAKEDAEKIARSKSGLGGYESWRFEAIPLKENQIRRRKYQVNY